MPALPGIGRAVGEPTKSTAVEVATALLVGAPGHGRECLRQRIQHMGGIAGGAGGALRSGYQQGDDFGAQGLRRDVQVRERDGQPKPAWARAARIEI